MFLLGGTAFSGKTLLAHLLNQGSVVCLDEPDFHDPGQSHRGIPSLTRLFPDKTFPAQPPRRLTYREAVEFIEQCERVIRPANLGMKTAGWEFLEYAKVYRESGYPVIGVIRDIRDVVTEGPLPDWIDGERGLNAEFRAVWSQIHVCDLWIRYEDLVARPESVLDIISTLIAAELGPVVSWSGESVPNTMLKLGRHHLLRAGRISREKVGTWRSSGRTFSTDTHDTAAMMGYGR